MKNYYTPEAGDEYPRKATCLSSLPPGEILIYLERIEKELEVQQEQLARLESRIEPIIAHNYPSDDKELLDAPKLETQIGSKLSTILLKIVTRNENISNLIDRVKL